jgi:hypothetical protein
MNISFEMLLFDVFGFDSWNSKRGSSFVGSQLPHARGSATKKATEEQCSAPFLVIPGVGQKDEKPHKERDEKSGKSLCAA